MAYDELIANRVRGALHGVHGVSERKMFGGIAFMVGGHMCSGVMGDSLMVRVGRDRYDELLAHEGAREMDFTGRPLSGFLFVSPEVFRTDASLQEWVEHGLDFVRSLPPK